MTRLVQRERQDQGVSRDGCSGHCKVVGYYLKVYEGQQAIMNDRVADASAGAPSDSHEVEPNRTQARSAIGR